jgi:hypothetical protein
VRGEALVVLVLLFSVLQADAYPQRGIPPGLCRLLVMIEVPVRAT